MSGRDGSDYRGVVDHVVGGVLSHVLLDSHLGDVVDLVVDLVADMLDHGSGVDEGLDRDVLAVGQERLCESWGGDVVSIAGEGVVRVGERMMSHSMEQLRVSLGQRGSLAGSEEREENLRENTESCKEELSYQELHEEAGE